MKTMQIYLSSHNTDQTIGDATNRGTISQTVRFVNVFNGVAGDEQYGEKPDEVSYKDRDRAENAPVCLLNYEVYNDQRVSFNLNETQGYAPITNSDSTLSAIYKQEIGPEGEELTKLKPVSLDLQSFKFRDFNISNNRRYKYVLYPFDQTQGKNIEKTVVATDYVHWNAWSITELHPADRTMKKFTATESDVWLFNLNVETGEQTQNLSRNEQQTLGQFNVFGQGRTNYVSGSVSCLLGRDVLPANYLKVIKSEYINSPKDKDIKQWTKWVYNGGYQETPPEGVTLTSNQRADMLLAWRKLVFSPNPKLLKDRAGQSFLVTISGATNKPTDGVRSQPNTISFNWTQIGTTDDVQILDLSMI